LDELKLEQAQKMDELKLEQAQKMDEQAQKMDEAKLEQAKQAQKMDEAKLEQARKKEPFLEEVAHARRRRLVPWDRESRRSQKEDQKFKKNLKSFYKRSVDNRVKCQILNTPMNSEDIIGAHIWKRATNGEGLEEFGLVPADIDNARNGLLLTKGIEHAFDHLQVCFLYNFTTNKLVLHVADTALLEESILLSKPPTSFKDVDGRELLCPKGKLPYRRLLSWHAYWTLKKAGKLRDYKQFHQLSVKSPGYNFPRDVENDEVISMMEAEMVASDIEDDSDDSGGSSEKQTFV
jgi:hypothetical protein